MRPKYNRKYSLRLQRFERQQLLRSTSLFGVVSARNVELANSSLFVSFPSYFQNESCKRVVNPRRKTDSPSCFVRSSSLYSPRAGEVRNKTVWTKSSPLDSSMKRVALNFHCRRLCVRIRFAFPLKPRTLLAGVALLSRGQPSLCGVFLTQP